jgi:hypothetical protein
MVVWDLTAQMLLEKETWDMEKLSTFTIHQVSGESVCFTAILAPCSLPHGESHHFLAGVPGPGSVPPWPKNSSQDIEQKLQGALLALNLLLLITPPVRPC